MGFAIKAGRTKKNQQITLGDIEDRGIRCPYHGWLFDVLGQCLEQPAEPKDGVFCQKSWHKLFLSNFF
jgi:phenylpropionate dioxygenase-like ring-hydroxylating dioxygenase large terminal subunit